MWDQASGGARGGLGARHQVYTAPPGCLRPPAVGCGVGQNTQKLLGNLQTPVGRVGVVKLCQKGCSADQPTGARTESRKVHYFMPVACTELLLYGGGTEAACHRHSNRGSLQLYEIYRVASFLTDPTPQKRVNCNSIKPLAVWVAPTRVARIEEALE